MNYKVSIKGFEKQNIEVQSGGLLAGPKLLVAGQPAPAGTKRGEFRLRTDAGKEVVATWKPQGMGLDVPQLMVDGTLVKVVEPLPWYAWAWSVLPLFMLFVGGAIGGVLGAIAAVFNVRVFRSSMPTVARFLITAVISGVAVILYVILASLLLSAAGR